jgi:hypothetical protein
MMRPIWSSRYGALATLDKDLRRAASDAGVELV